MNSDDSNVSRATYESFGQLLVSLRRQAGIARQADFAVLVKTKQQSVSRWENGQSRPREKQIPLLAAILTEAAGWHDSEKDRLTEKLIAAGGYGKPSAIVSFDLPFPLEALLPESFERFCATLIQRLYRDASVHRAGSSGHKQDGTDILAVFPDGTKHSFQCKRTDEFGPERVHAAIRAHTLTADKKFILLSRVASPQARQALASHKDWDLWDKDDISSKIRELPKVDQVNLVDIFFPGKRHELLGFTEEGVWESTEDFFAAFDNAKGLFNHTWDLVGQNGPLAELKKLLADKSARVIHLLGSGGSGKSRILKQALESYVQKKRGDTVRFLARTAEITQRSLEELGNEATMLVVDDAHDRTDLARLFQFVATHPQFRLLFALRPYGLDHLKAQASNFSLADGARVIKIEPLTKEEAERLATQVLKKEGGPLLAAKDIAKLTNDCPLATVVGAQIVSREKKLFDLAKNEDAFRSTLFGRFEAVIAGEIGSKSDAVNIKKMLKVLALFQPFYIDDKGLLQVIEKLEDIKPHDTNRLLKLLAEGGVLFKRGARYRLSPDVLADYIIESNCVGPQNTSTGYAEAAFDAANEKLIGNLLLNLSKLDWCRSDGDPSNSRLLDTVWAKLQPEQEYSDPYISAVTAVAYYQPRRAIEFGEKLIKLGHFTNQLSELFKYASFNFAYVTRACEALWEMGRNDKRELHPHPEHPIRVLTELCEVQPNKPLEYIQEIVDFGLRLAQDPKAWESHYTPMDILAAVFKTEGYTTTSSHKAIRFNPFAVTAKFIEGPRSQVLDLLIRLLCNKNIRIAGRAASSIGDAIRYPTGLFNAKISKETRDSWTVVFKETLRQLERAVKTNTYDPIVLFGIAKGVSWHANYSKETKAEAKRVVAAIESSLDYRVLSTLADGWGHELRRMDRENFEEAWQKHLNGLAEEVVRAHPDGEGLRAYLEQQIARIIESGVSDVNSAQVFYGTLLRHSPDLARATIRHSCQNPDSGTTRSVADAVLALWLKDNAEARKIIDDLIATGREDLLNAAGWAMSAFDFQREPYQLDDRRRIEVLVKDSRPSIVIAGINAIKAVLRADADEAFTLISKVNIGDSPRVADELLCIFCFKDYLPFEHLSKDDIEGIFERLMAVPELKGHWVEAFLAEASKTYPYETLRFFTRRVDRAVSCGDWKYRPINHGPYVYVALKFNETPEYVPILAGVCSWLAKYKPDPENAALYNYRAGQLFEAIFGNFDAEVVKYIERWSETADEADFKLISVILEEAPHSFVFEQSSFVVEVVHKAHKVSERAFKSVKSAIYSSAVGGVRKGVAGEPFQRDLKMKESAEAILATLSRFSPAYEIYEALLKHAEAEIERALIEKDDED